MNITLWVLQIVLAVVFFAHGWLFLMPPPDIAVQMNASFPRWFQLSLGVAEILAAVGLVLPGVTRIFPWLVAWSAGGVTIIMILATIFHLLRAEFASAAITAVLLAMASFAAYARWQMAPIRQRQTGTAVAPQG